MYLEVAALYGYSYLAGAVPTPYLIAKLTRGIDLREYGSGNVGGSNVVRQLGKVWIVPLTLVELLLKGFSPFVLGLLVFGPPRELPLSSLCLFLASPLLALIGNNWSPFLRFQGGRGLMVICGIVFSLAPALFAVGMSVYLLGWRVSRSSAVWALIATASLPVLALWPGGYLVTSWIAIWALMGGEALQSAPSGYAAVISCYCGLILVMVLVKRGLSNSPAFPEGLSKKKVIFNRLVRDRDVDERAEWISRIPQ
ncbi:MAG: hypothetical protein F4X65_00595 [Chloroflexi bacterium]|nr:hypothetical protein [Chloroflexota bacterium]